ncbi:MAG: hypothetical protein H6R01_504 [Burkholderiaceae bacterium]|nr:hypothetical protein [Burkholderiaceae bacterium]
MEASPASKYPALSHFLFVGLGYALALGWMGTMVVNNVIGVAAELLTRTDLTRHYAGALLLTISSIAIIGACIWYGNLRFSRWWTGWFERRHLLCSTFLYLLLVLVIVVPQFGSVFGLIGSNLSAAYRDSSDALLMLSLPAIRLLALPALYYFIASHHLLSISALPERERLLGLAAGASEAKTVARNAYLRMFVRNSTIFLVLLGAVVLLYFHTVPELYQRAYPKISHDGKFLLVVEDERVRKFELSDRSWSSLPMPPIGADYSLSLDSQWLLASYPSKDGGATVNRIRIAPPHDVEKVYASPYPIYSPSEIAPGTYLMQLSSEPRRGRGAERKLWHTLEPGGKLTAYGTDEDGLPWDRNVAVTAQGIIRAQWKPRQGAGEQTLAEEHMNLRSIPFGHELVPGVEAMVTPDTVGLTCSRDLSTCLRQHQANVQGAFRYWLDAVVKGQTCAIEGWLAGFYRVEAVYVSPDGRFGSARVARRHNDVHSAIVIRFADGGCPRAEIISFKDGRR